VDGDISVQVARSADAPCTAEGPTRTRDDSTTSIAAHSLRAYDAPMTRPPHFEILLLVVLLGACGGEAPSAPDASRDALADALPPPSEQPPPLPDAAPDGAPSWRPAPGAVCGGGCVDTSRDPAHCGVCDRGCLNGTSCVAGACAYPRNDGGFDTPPDTVVADDRTPPPDASEVGADVHVAPTDVPAEVIACARGFLDCDDNSANGCETNTLGDDVNNCGGCGRRCPWIGSEIATCTSGACGVVCSPGFANCPASSRGCGTSLTTNENNCGACGARCGPFANAVPLCDVGRCIMGACSANYANCDGSAARV